LKVYLVNPPFGNIHFQRDMRWQESGRSSTYNYPLWLAYATGVLEQAQFECRLIDAPAKHWGDEEIKRDIWNFKPDMVVVNTSFPSLNNDIKFARFIKEIDDCKVSMVGTPANQFSVEMLKSGYVDYVARLEFDFVLRDLMLAIRDNKDGLNVKGISYIRDGEIIHNPNREWSTGDELDSIPFVSQVYKKHLKTDDYMLNYSHSMFPNIQIISGRGCPNFCHFCPWTENLTGRKYRHRSIANVLDEVTWIEEKLPKVKQFFFEDDAFTISKKFVIDFCEGYKKRKLRIPWGAQSRVGIDLETMVAMKSSNCRFIDTGCESGNDDILKNVQKGITVEDIRKCFKNAKRAKLSVHGNWIVGLPGETKQTVKNTWNLIKEVKPDAITVAIATPHSGTKLYEYVKSHNYLEDGELVDDCGHQRSVISYPELSSKEIALSVDKMLRDYYVSFSYIPIALRRIFSRYGLYEIRVLWRSMTSFLKYINRRKVQ
jgi:anaerobic magnesium-protoporphyrin IX monomethyl ester cyclase